MDLNNLKAAIKAIIFLSLGSGIAGIMIMISIIMVALFANQVSLGNIPITNSANNTIQSVTTTIITAEVTLVGLITLVSGIASIVIVVLALIGKINFVEVAGLNGKSKNKMF